MGKDGWCKRKRGLKLDHRTDDHVIGHQDVLEVPRFEGELSLRRGTPLEFRNLPTKSHLSETSELQHSTTKLLKPSRPFFRLTNPEANNLDDLSLYYFTKENRFRVVLIRAFLSATFKNWLDAFFLSFYVRLTVLCILNRIPHSLDGFDYLVGTAALLTVLCKIVAFGFIGHSDSFLLRHPFNFFEMGLAIVFFIPGLYYLQVFQSFRLFTIINRLSFLRFMAQKSKIIKRSMFSLTTFVLIYLLLVFISSVVSQSFFPRSMNKYCVAGPLPDKVTQVVNCLIRIRL